MILIDYYQGSYEFDFLELCEKIGILNKIKNGNYYEYLKEDKIYGNKTLTDFSYLNYEIEIKSSFILEKQGGLEKLKAKKRAVESKNKKYIFILDKEYKEFINLINKKII